MEQLWRNKIYYNRLYSRFDAFIKEKIFIILFRRSRTFVTVGYRLTETMTTEIENYLNFDNIDNDYKLDIGIEQLLLPQQPSFDIEQQSGNQSAIASTSQHPEQEAKAIDTNELTTQVKKEEEEPFVEQPPQLTVEDADEHSSDTNSVPSTGSIRQSKRKRTQKDVNITSAAAEANLSPQEYNKLSSKEKRQLRNKISARAFRLRRKDYIEQLESQLNSRDELIEQLQSDLKDSKTESNDLRKEIQSLKLKFDQLSTSASGSSSLPLANTNKDLGLFGNTPATPPISSNFMSVYTTLMPETNIKDIYNYSSHQISQPPPAYTPSNDLPPSYAQSTCQTASNLLNSFIIDSKKAPKHHHDISSSFANCLKI